MASVWGLASWFQKHDVYTSHRCLLITLECDNSWDFSRLSLSTCQCIRTHIHTHTQRIAHIHSHIVSPLCLLFVFFYSLFISTWTHAKPFAPLLFWCRLNATDCTSEEQKKNKHSQYTATQEEVSLQQHTWLMIQMPTLWAIIINRSTF